MPNITVNGTVKHRNYFPIVSSAWCEIHMVLSSDLKSRWSDENFRFLIEDRRKIGMFVFKITDVNMHAEQELLTLLNNVQELSFPCFFSCVFLFSLLLVKIIHFLTARRRSNSQTRRFGCRLILRRRTNNLNFKLSTDVEKKPVMQSNSSIMQLVSSMILMHSWFYELGSQAIDVVGAGECFFRSVLHQLYGNNNHRMQVRSAGVQYMRDHPERFVESNTENSWLRYLNNMCIQGTWADALIV